MVKILKFDHPPFKKKKKSYYPIVSIQDILEIAFIY